MLQRNIASQGLAVGDDTVS
ncbi:hypothetical protein C359_02669 [Cryptococcus neoformans Bt120]|nr:hypothetical protein C359_02669 [Cryptococcus neoformans var. grubii Bt120]